MVLTSTRSQCLRRSGLALAVVWFSLSACGSEAVGAEGRGRALYDTCLPCHGPDAHGQQYIAAPAIAGQAAWYIKDQLENFRSGKRGYHHTDMPGQRMRPMAKTLLLDGDVEAVAAYVSQLPPLRPTPTLTGGDAVKGKEVYMLCAACHGADGQGQEPLHSPSLTKTQDWYLLTQLNHYMAGRRGAALGDVWGGTMRGIAVTLDSEKVRDVMAYINTLRIKE